MIPATTQRLTLRIENRKVLVGVPSIPDAVRMFLTLQRGAMRRTGTIVRFATVYDENMHKVARISQNGRAWAPVEWQSGMEPLYEPTAADWGCHENAEVVS